ncbi:acyl-CoA dehydrogenase NM domain-like protein [Venturia nashicola]|nr:acyl-CoA dehydrogenase NM domain-like protein [Venturia nashicola]
MANPQKVGFFDFQGPLWSPYVDNAQFATAAEIKVHYDRARSMLQATGIYTSHLIVYLLRTPGMTIQDIVSLSPKFWNFNLDPSITRDIAAFTILTIHWNLCMGTIAAHASKRPDLQEILRELEQFNVCGEFMLTELGHGLDARNLGTTATMRPDGSFVLHTPSPNEAKTMPPITPYAGIARVGVVFAQLVVGEEKRGIKPFLVRLNEIGHMCAGVSSRMLPQRAGSKPVDHAITMFENVQLTSNALLGSPERAKDPRLEFMNLIGRVGVGTLSLSMTNVPCLNVGAHIMASYCRRRQVGNEESGQKIPIWNFRTVHLPILSALAHGHVLTRYAKKSANAFIQPKEKDWRIKHAYSCIFKATATQCTQAILSELIDRCGWQGLFGYNQLSEMMLSLRGNSIAEGDVLVLCIRLASELFQGKYMLPKTKHPRKLLARHEAGLLLDAHSILHTLPKGHRDEDFDAKISIKCRPFIEAIGQRMAYEAALEDPTTRPELLQLYEIQSIKSDLAWYVENLGLKRQDILDLEDKVVRKVAPLLDQILRENGVGSVVTAPIVSEKKWEDFVTSLPSFGSIESGSDVGCVGEDGMILARL